MLEEGKSDFIKTYLEKITEIEWENRMLLEKIANIMIKDPKAGSGFNG